MLKHIQAKTSLATLIESTIQAYQMQASLADSILTDTSHLPWTPNQWINNLCEALHTIQGQIILNNPWIIPHSQVNDQHLMADFVKAGHKPNTLKLLNNCRMFLQVTTLTEIMNSTGTHLLPKILLWGWSQPTLAHISTSNYNWPTQPDPSHSAWKIWTKALQEHYTKPGLPTTLCNPHGQWTIHATTIQTWVNTYDPQTHQGITQEINKPTMRHILQHQTHHHAYYNNSCDMTDLAPTRHPVT